MTSIVNNLANKLADLTTGTAPAASATADKNEAVSASAAEGRRLYIGNLAYATTEEQLKEFFTGYSVESTSIPTNPRTSRPVGYAFVDLATAAEAEKAITELSGKDILERKVSVQLARKPEPAAPKEVVEGETNGTAADGSRRRGSGRGRARGRGGRGGPGGRAREGEDGVGAAAPAEAETTTAVTAVDGGAAASEPAPAADGDKAKQLKERRQRGPPEDGIPSKTKVMVANLPYNLSEEKLKELFAAYQPTASKIALRPIPRFMVRKLQARNEPRKGRGFGFVTLPSEELQLKAVEEMNGKEVEGREIAVKVAIDSPGREDGTEDDVKEAGAGGAAEEAAPVAA